MHSVTFTPAAPRCSFYSWEEGTKADSSKRVVQDKANHRTYTNGVTDQEIQSRLQELFLFSLTLGFPLRLAARVIHLVTGTWAFVGYEKAQIVWMQRINHQENNSPSLFKYRLIILQHIGSELAEHIVKCVTLPLCFIALTGASLYGQIRPLDARAFFGNIERFWSISLSMEKGSACDCHETTEAPTPWDQVLAFRAELLRMFLDSSNIGITAPFIIIASVLTLTVLPFIYLISRADASSLIEAGTNLLGEVQSCAAQDQTNYIARCMQPKEIWQKENLYRFDDHYDVSHPSSLVRELKQYEKWGFFQLGVRLDDLKQIALASEKNYAIFVLKELLEKCQELQTYLNNNPQPDLQELAKLQQAIEEIVNEIRDFEHPTFEALKRRASHYQSLDYFDPHVSIDDVTEEDHWKLLALVEACEGPPSEDLNAESISQLLNIDEYTFFREIRTAILIFAKRKYIILSKPLFFLEKLEDYLKQPDSLPLVQALLASCSQLEELRLEPDEEDSVSQIQVCKNEITEAVKKLREHLYKDEELLAFAQKLFQTVDFPDLPFSKEEIGDLLKKCNNRPSLSSSIRPVCQAAMLQRLPPGLQDQSLQSGLNISLPKTDSLIDELQSLDREVNLSFEQLKINATNFVLSDLDLSLLEDSEKASELLSNFVHIYEIYDFYESFRLSSPLELEQLKSAKAASIEALRNHIASET